MAKVNPELARLRAEIARTHRNTGRKISRNMATKGIDISVHDPRVSAEKIGRYTAQQLIAYKKRLDAFNGRGTQFEAGAGNVPLTKFAEYKRWEKLVNKKSDDRINAYGHLVPPGSKTSIKEYEEQMVNQKNRMQGGDARNKPYEKYDRAANNFVSDEAIDKVIKTMKKKLTRGYHPAYIKKQRENAKKLTGEMGLVLEGVFDSLTDNQFDILWSEHPHFANSLSGMYHIAKSRVTRAGERWYDSVSDDKLEAIQEAIAWAATLPEEHAPVKKRKARPRKRS